MIRKISERENLKKVKLFESTKLPLNESVTEEEYGELKGKYWDLAEAVADLFGSELRGLYYTAEDVMQVVGIAKTWGYTISDMIKEQFEEGLATEWDHITLATIEYQIYYNAWAEVAHEMGIDEKYGQDTGYYSTEYGIWEEGQWVEHNTDIDSDGRLEFNVIIDPEEGERERVYNKEELIEAVKKRIAWEESNYQGDWDPDQEEEEEN